jgi:mono/diheme cytochrome c family protein
MPWQRRAISASLASGKQADCLRVARFAANATNTDRMRKVAVGVLQSWLDPSNREIVEGRWAPIQNKASRSVVPLTKEMPSLIDSAHGELLTKVLQLAQFHDIALPDGLSRDLLMDDGQPVSLREHALRNLIDDEAIAYGLNSEHWQLRAVARDVMINQGDVKIMDALLQVVKESAVPEAQAALISLARTPAGKKKLALDELSPELHLEYWEATSFPHLYPDPYDGDWLTVGGSPEKGRQVVFEHSASQCLRCHKIKDDGGIAGPPLDSVGSALTDRELLEALLTPSKRIAEGFGEYSAMPPVGGVLDHREIRDVVAYLKSLQSE